MEQISIYIIYILRIRITENSQSYANLTGTEKEIERQI